MAKQQRKPSSLDILLLENQRARREASMVVSTSLSILPSTRSFPTTSSTDSSSTSTSLTFIPFKYHSNSNLSFSKPPMVSSLRFPHQSSKILAFSSNNTQSVENGSAEQFLGNNSIADFMRFKKGSDRSSGELQTALVSYRKRFPWSIFNPFLRVPCL